MVYTHRFLNYLHVCISFRKPVWSTVLGCCNVSLHSCQQLYFLHVLINYYCFPALFLLAVLHIFLCCYFRLMYPLSIFHLRHCDSAYLIPRQLNWLLFWKTTTEYSSLEPVQCECVKFLAWSWINLFASRLSMPPASLQVSPHDSWVVSIFSRNFLFFRKLQPNCDCLDVFAAACVAFKCFALLRPHTSLLFPCFEACGLSGDVTARCSRGRGVLLQLFHGGCWLKSAQLECKCNNCTS